MWRRRETTWPTQSDGRDPSADDDMSIVQRSIMDKEAFAALYERYLPSVHRRCLSRLRDREEAWDATGTTFVKALAAIEGFHGGSFEGWLNRIAENVCKDMHRGRHPDIPFDEHLDRPAIGSDPEELALAAMDRELLDSALACLTPRREQIIRLRLSGLTGREIAARLGISYEVARKQQSLALHALADLLDVEHERKEDRND